MEREKLDSPDTLQRNNPYKIGYSYMQRKGLLNKDMRFEGIKILVEERFEEFS